jgi:hypothetical protein
MRFQHHRSRRRLRARLLRGFDRSHMWLPLVVLAAVLTVVLAVYSFVSLLSRAAGAG